MAYVIRRRRVNKANLFSKTVKTEVYFVDHLHIAASAVNHSQRTSPIRTSTEIRQDICFKFYPLLFQITYLKTVINLFLSVSKKIY